MVCFYLYNSFLVLLSSSVDKETSSGTTTSTSTVAAEMQDQATSANASTSSSSSGSTSFYSTSFRPPCVFRSHIGSNPVETTYSNTTTTTLPTPLPTIHSIPNVSSTTSPNSWLAARLLFSGQDIQLVRDVEQKLVKNEGFVQERDFAECAPGIISSAYLTSIGITGLGMQRCLMRLQSELHAQCAQVSVVPYLTTQGSSSTNSGGGSIRQSSSQNENQGSKKRKSVFNHTQCD